MGYRPLAQKYNVSPNTLKGIAKKENWIGSRDEYRNNMRNEARKLKEERTPEPGQVERACTVFDAADILLKRILSMTEKTELRASDIRSLTAALKDIREIKMIADGNTPRITLRIAEDSEDD